VGTKPFVEALVEEVPSDQVRAHAEAFRQGGQTLSFLALDKKVAAVFAMEDPVRSDAAATVQDLKRLGLEVHLLTGDGPVVAERVARRVGADAFQAGSAPGGKLDYVKALQAAGKRVAVVGDGHNDAPALVQADLGIALGTGADSAREAGDLVLVKPELAKVAEAIRISRSVLAVIRQNLAWAFGYNLLMVPLAALAPVPPAVAALAMSFSSVTVVGNALRLYWKWR
jgi:Cu+-exporting ATPase